MKGVAVYRLKNGMFNWEPDRGMEGSWLGMVIEVQEMGSEAFPEWFPSVNYAGEFTRKQIDLLAAVLRLNGIEVIER